MRHPTDRISHTTAFVTAVVEHWLEREIAYKERSELNITETIVITSQSRDPFDVVIAKASKLNLDESVTTQPSSTNK